MTFGFEGIISVGSGDNLDDHVCHTGNDGMKNVSPLLSSYQILPYSTEGGILCAGELP